MKRRNHCQTAALSLAVVACLGAENLLRPAGLLAGETGDKPVSPPPSAPVERPDPKPLSGNVRKGLAYLQKSQRADGGWGQGGGWRLDPRQDGGRVEGAEIEDPADIGNTAIALLAFSRAGESFVEGPYAETMRKAAEHLLEKVDADDESLYVTRVRDTQLQSKIGRYVDTFLTALVLSELKGELPDPGMEKRREALLAKVVDKIEKHQKADGTFEGNEGWAAVLSQGLCSLSLNRAWLAGAGVSDETLKRDSLNNAAGVVAGARVIATTAGEPSSAGIDLYRYAAKLGGLQGQAQINQSRKAAFAKTLESSDAGPEAKEAARSELSAIDKNDSAAQAASAAAAAQLREEAFVAGFGNNGGEEFLSYMSLGEAMWAKGGEEWRDWEARMIPSVNGAQNEDGSWAGQHCITGRTFCTATALLTLMADRSPIPAAAAERGVAGAPNEARAPADRGRPEEKTRE